LLDRPFAWKIASDIRLLGMGPRAGIAELALPETQPGSSIMPGKVNPVIVESLTMVVARVIGNDATIAFGQTGSFLELTSCCRSRRRPPRAGDRSAEHRQPARCVEGARPPSRPKLVSRP
jgi:hypothetical protein